MGWSKCRMATTASMWFVISFHFTSLPRENVRFFCCWLQPLEMIRNCRMTNLRILCFEVYSSCLVGLTVFVLPRPAPDWKWNAYEAKLKWLGVWDTETLSARSRCRFAFSRRPIMGKTAGLWTCLFSSFIHYYLTLSAIESNCSHARAILSTLI